MAHSIAILERIRERLTSLPKPDQRSKQLNKQASIGFLSKELIASLRDGHTLDELAEVLAQEGVAMTPVALKSHLRRVRPQGRRGKAAGRALAPVATPAQSARHHHESTVGEMLRAPRGAAAIATPVERNGAPTSTLLPPPPPGARTSTSISGAQVSSTDSVKR